MEKIKKRYFIYLMILIIFIICFTLDAYKFSKKLSSQEQTGTVRPMSASYDSNNKTLAYKFNEGGNYYV